MPEPDPTTGSALSSGEPLYYTLLTPQRETAAMVAADAVVSIPASFKATISNIMASCHSFLAWLHHINYMDLSIP
jgi:hypothetical protein